MGSWPALIGIRAERIPIRLGVNGILAGPDRDQDGEDPDQGGMGSKPLGNGLEWGLRRTPIALRGERDNPVR